MKKSISSHRKLMQALLCVICVSILHREAIAGYDQNVIDCRANQATAIDELCRPILIQAENNRPLSHDQKAEIKKQLESIAENYIATHPNCVDVQN